MTVNNQKDVIIVGQGIAGSVMALAFIKAGYSVCVIDKPSLSHSSKVAAGIWNPVVFKRLAKSWLADDLVPELISFYEWAEILLGKSFVHKRPIVKAFGEEQEEVFWKKKAQNDNEFLDKTIHHNLQLDEYSAIKSYSHVLQAGYIDLSVFLNETQNYLKTQHTLIEEEIDYKELTQLENSVTYKHVTAQRIVFCEGHLVSGNPLFNYIPLKPAKGEILTISSNHFLWKESIINKGFFILPLGNNTYKVGATYEWQSLNDTPTEERKQELCKKLEAVIASPYTILKHEAGVRPSAIDRRPVIGAHPLHTNYFIFNGFGTKGVMLAPYFAKQLIAFIEHKTELDKEVDVKRFN